MHNLYFVVIPKKQATDNKEAMDLAMSFLNEENFSGGGFYGGGKADWFETGGRWSGFFTELQDWYCGFKADVDELLKNKYPKLDSGVYAVFYGDKKKEKQKEKAIDEVKKMWKKHLPKDYLKVSCPLGRCGTFSWNNNPFGADRDDIDDSVMMTTDLFNKVVRECGESECVDLDEMRERNVGGLKKEEAIGKWWVIIDYHC